MSISLIGATSLASGTDKTAGGTTLTATATITVPAGALLLAFVAADNIGSGSAAPCALSDNGGMGGTWAAVTGTPVANALAANAGSAGYIFWKVTTAAISAVSVTFTATFSGGTIPTAKCLTVGGWTSTLAFASVEADLLTLKKAVAKTGGNFTDSWTVVAAALEVGSIHAEQNTVPAGDGVNGWSGVNGTATTGGGSAANQAVEFQHLVTGGAGTQTFAATDASDLVYFGVEVVEAPPKAFPDRRRTARRASRGMLVR